MTDGLELLTGDHRAVRSLFSDYERSGEDSVARRIFDALAVHARIEERALYPQVRDALEDGGEQAVQAESEHAAIAALVARMQQTPPEDLRRPMGELQERVEAHVADEEDELFPRLREQIDVEELGRALEVERTKVPVQHG